MFFNEDHIRVYRPVTSDGRNPVIGTDGRPMQKVVHLPKTAKPLLLKKNSKLPQHLQVRIEDVPFTYVPPVKEVDTEKQALEAKVKDLEEKLAVKVVNDFKDKVKPA